MKLNLEKYNARLSPIQQLSWEDATNLNNEMHSGSIFTSTDIPPSVKLQAVQQHHKLSRAEEEIIRVKLEMVTCVNNCINRYYTVDNRMNVFAKGSICLLKRCLKRCAIQLKSFQCFLHHVALPNLESMFHFLKHIEEESVINRGSEEENEQVSLCLADSLSIDDVDDDDDYDNDTPESK